MLRCWFAGYASVSTAICCVSVPRPPCRPKVRWLSAIRWLRKLQVRFCAPVKPENIITETLQRVTPVSDIPAADTLAKAISAGVPQNPDFKSLREHPISAWVELTLGLSHAEGRWVRAKPLSIEEAAARLAECSGVSSEHCATYLSEFLLTAYQCKDVNGKPLFAFRLHQFVSGAADLFATLETPGVRKLDLSGQLAVAGSVIGVSIACTSAAIVGRSTTRSGTR